MRTRRVLRSLAALVLAAGFLLGGCGADDGSLSWSAVDAPTGARDGLAWADVRTGEVHLPGGDTVSAEGPISGFVVAGDGAFVVTEDDAELVEVTDGGVRPTGAVVDEEPKASPDGRYLAFVDARAGEEVEDGLHVLTWVVVDLERGTEVLRSTRGMGDPESDDLADLYEDAAYGVLGVSDETAWLAPPAGDVLEVDLDSGEVTTLEDVEVADDTQPWARPSLPPPAEPGSANPGRTWATMTVSRPDPDLSSDPDFVVRRDELVSADGDRVVPRTDAATWHLVQWVDDTTVVAVADEHLGRADRLAAPPPRSLLTCTVPDGACERVPDTENAVLPEPSLY